MTRPSARYVPGPVDEPPSRIRARARYGEGERAATTFRADEVELMATIVNTIRLGNRGNTELLLRMVNSDAGRRLSAKVYRMRERIRERRGT